MAKRRRARRKKPLKFAIILVLCLILIFAATFLIFFRLLGGSFRDEDIEACGDCTTQSPVATEVIATTSPTAAPMQRATVVPTAAPKATQQPVVTEQGDPVELRGGAYAYPTHKTVITNDELKELTRSEIKIIFNEIYARHGLTFNDEELVDYFEMQQWYRPTTTSSKTAESQFSNIEWENYRIIYDYQKAMGWRT